MFKKDKKFLNSEDILIDNSLYKYSNKEVEKINREEFLEQLIKEYGKLVFSICYRITKNYFDSEDLTQDTFLAVYKNLEQFDGEHIKAWISKIATNKCLDYMKQGARRVIITEDNYFLDIVSSHPEPIDVCLEDEVKEHIARLCKELKPPYDEIAYEHICRGKTAKELSYHKNLPLKTIQTQIYRAKNLLREHLRKEQL